MTNFASKQSLILPLDTVFSLGKDCSCQISISCLCGVVHSCQVGMGLLLMVQSMLVGMQAESPVAEAAVAEAAVVEP